MKGIIIMEIRFAETRDIPGMINLLLEVGEVHHRIRPDLFRAGAQKYDELLEVTPKNLRIRKTILNHERRMKAQHGKKN